METINGYETARCLRRDPRFARTPIIFLTAQCELNDKLAAFEASGDDFLTKPFETAELLAPLKRTWSDITKIEPYELDWEALQTIIGRHDSGVQFIAAPTYPSEAELITQELFAEAFKLLRANFDYIVADLPHDFSAITLDILDAAIEIVVLLAPEIASLRAAIASMDTFQKLGFPDGKVRVGLNMTFDRKGIPRKKVEAALNHPVDLVLPFAPDQFIDAINAGRPILYMQPDEAVAEKIISFANELSMPEHRNHAGLLEGLPRQGIKGIFSPLKK